MRERYGHFQQLSHMFVNLNTLKNNVCIVGRIMLSMATAYDNFSLVILHNIVLLYLLLVLHKRVLIGDSVGHIRMRERLRHVGIEHRRFTVHEVIILREIAVLARELHSVRIRQIFQLLKQKLVNIHDVVIKWTYLVSLCNALRHLNYIGLVNRRQLPAVASQRHTVVNATDLVQHIQLLVRYRLELGQLLEPGGA